MILEQLSEFPALSYETLRNLRKTLDIGFRQFTREFGEISEIFFEPLQKLLIFVEELLINSPWWIIMLLILVFVWFISRSYKLVISTALAFFFVGIFGMWVVTMQTMAMIVVATLVILIIGLPIGILLSQSNRLQQTVFPILDIMQTLPSFVYLIPIVMLLGIGRVPGLIAVVIYAIPPVIRFTNLGIRLVSKDVLEAAEAYGASTMQKMFRVQLPLALPTIMAGINQSIMLALSMVVIAAMIGVQGLGQQVLRAINNQYFTMGLLNGFAIVVIAIVFDRVSQSYGKRLQKHLEVTYE